MGCKRTCFAIQKDSFWGAKGLLLSCKRTRFGVQKDYIWKSNVWKLKIKLLKTKTGDKNFCLSPAVIFKNRPPSDVMKLRVYKIWELSAFVIHRLCSLVHWGFYMARHWQKKSSRFRFFYWWVSRSNWHDPYVFLFLSAKLIFSRDTTKCLRHKFIVVAFFRSINEQVIELFHIFAIDY